MLDNPSQGRPAAATEKFFHQELVTAFAAHYRLLILGPILAAVTAYFVVSLAPRGYTSWAYLKLDKPTSRSFEAIATSPGVAGKVLEKYPDVAGSSIEHRVRFVQANTRWTDIDPNADRPQSRLVRFEVTNRDARLAQSISTDLIDAWLETTRPGSIERAVLLSELERTKAAAAANSALTDQLQKEARILVQPNTQAGELATPIAALITKRDQLYATMQVIQNKLDGVPRDVIIQPPHLPQQQDPPRRLGAAILSGMVALLLLLMTVLLVRFFAPSRAPLQVVAGFFRRAS